nr:MAG TPA: tail protein [Caudoviricetes sp.]
MIKSVTITNHLDESIKLDLFNPEESGFIIKNIDGLGPVKANINFKELATNDGAIDNSARLSSRNIVMSLQFIESPTIEETRLKSYKYFPIKRNIKILIKTDNRICETIGRVETNVPTIFSNAEGCQISILCPNPYFYSAGENGANQTIFYGTDPLFEFPFSNESLTEDLIEFGSIENRTEGTVYYDGDAEIGITIQIHAVGEAAGLVIYNTRTREFMRINDDKLKSLIGSGIQAGDEITITTSRGEKGIYILRNGVTTNILNSLEKPIKWFQLSKGDNTFAYTASAGLTNLQFRIENKVIYEGV